MSARMKLLSTWTGVIVVTLLAMAMLAVAVIQYGQAHKPTALISAAGLAVIAAVLARRILRRKPAPPEDKKTGPLAGPRP